MAKNYNILHFASPPHWWGEKWREGLYLGNGLVGADIYGGAVDERVLINDARVNWKGRTTVVPDVSDCLPELAERVSQGEFVRAQKVLPNALAAKNFRPHVELPMPLCQLGLHFVHNMPTKGYRRALDMERGTANVTYSVGQTTYIRDMFVSRADNVVVYRLTKNGNAAISLRLQLTPAVSYGADEQTDFIDGAETVYEKRYICFAARNDDTGADYGVVVKVAPLGGTMRADDEGLVVNNAQSVLIFVKTFVGSREKQWATLKLELDGMRDGYEKMLKAHVALHSKLFGGATLRLHDGDECDVDELIAATESGALSPLLTEKMYKFARYLFVSGTSDQSDRLFAPCGLWNGSYNPHRSFLTYDGQMQTSYLFALQGNMFQGLDKTFDLFERYNGDYKNNAQRIFGCRGVVVPAVQAPKTGRLGTTDVFGVHFSGSAAWLCSLYYKYARYSGNTRFLKSKLIPFMKEVALFYIDFFHEGESGLEAVPTPLPIRVGDYRSYERPVVAKNSVLDFELARELFANLIEACNACNVKPDPRWQQMLDKIPHAQVGSDGAMREFVNSIVSVDYSGVSNGTLYPAYFGYCVDVNTDDEVKRLYERTADRKRANPSLQNSFNLCVLASVYARLGLADKASACLADALRGCVVNNLVLLDKDWRGMGVCGDSAVSPVQLNTNLAFANAVQQMLLYSHNGFVKVLPAVPDGWYVEYNDFVCDNGVSVSVKRNPAKGTFRVSLFARKEANITLSLPDNCRKLTKCSLSDKPQGTEFRLTLPAGKAVELVYKIPVDKQAK